jgi:hypothetical protein
MQPQHRKRVVEILMGSSFFKPSSPHIGPGGTNLAARALAAPGYATRPAAAGAQKNIGIAAALNKSKFKPQKTNSAYAKGPKV